MNRVNRYVEDLLDQRRPRPFRPSPAEAAELRAAIQLHAGNRAAAEPDAGFVADLGRRLAAAAAGTGEVAEPGETAESAEPADDPAADQAGERPGGAELFRFPSRRGFVRTATVAAASAAGAVLVDRLVDPGGHSPTSETATPQETVRPDSGAWHTVLASDQLPVGGVREFDAGTVSGFVQRTPTGVRAISAVCTHLGCRLLLTSDAEQLVCPCHHAIFALTGDVVHYRLPTELRPLPRIQARESEGAIQVFVPTT